MSDNDILARARQWSGALRRQLMARPEFAPWLVEASQSVVDRHAIASWHNALLAEVESTHACVPNPHQELIPTLPRPLQGVVLRRLRQRVFYTLMVRDLTREATLREVVTAMSLLADRAVAHAYRSAVASLVPVHGLPRDPTTGLPQELLIIGMGKLGGRELNVSSDIDLIMVYAEEGETDGDQPVRHQDFYRLVIQRMTALLSDLDANGQVFRCDLRLRPDGSAGPLAWSLPALEKYFIRQGREWERYAWIKARILPCQAFTHSQARAHAERLETLRQPFVYRHYLDFDALAALRQLRERIRENWERQARTRRQLDKAHHIKLGDGGIREIEFIVHLTQLIRGGQLPSLQQRGLHAALYKQHKAGLLSESTYERLQSAYFFLRRVEHLLQYREDEQTHTLPSREEDRQALARAAGMDTADFEAQLAAHRQFVSKTFQTAFRLAGIERASPPQESGAAPAPARSKAAAQTQTISDWLSHPRLRALPAHSRHRLQTLGASVARIAAQQSNPALTQQRLQDLIVRIAPRSGYLALLDEYPAVLERVASLVGASPWAAQYLQQHPLLLDSLLTWNTLMSPPDFDELARQLGAELDASTLPDGQPDVEQQMNLMRDMQHQVTFRLLAQDLAGQLSVETLADYLSELADRLLEETIRRVWPLVSQSPATGGTAPRFAIIAYGKLGGKELGYASDLDLVFLYDDDDQKTSEHYTRLGRRVSSWLSTLTSSGRLYEVDLRLRPDGDAGLLAVTIGAFEHYQLEQAWTWEHQAITRARHVAGDPTIGQRFESVRQNILLRERDPDTLRQEICAMRQRMLAGHPNPTADFDLKHDRGGMVDVEFIIQFLILLHARQHAVLLQNLGNTALLQHAADAGLINTGLASQVAQAYRLYRKRQHALRLQGAQRARVNPAEVTQERQQVLALWEAVMGEPAAL